MMRLAPSRKLLSALHRFQHNTKQLNIPKRSITHALPVLGPPNPPSMSTQPEEEGTSYLKSMVKRYSPFSQKERVYQAEAFFQAATFQANDARWFGPARVSREFRSRHAILTLHIWLLHKRLLHDTVDKDGALLVQEELFNILWEDTICRIRKEGVNELLVNKNLMKVQQYTFLHLTHYDHAYTEFLNKPEERLKELRKLLWQHVYLRDESLEDWNDLLDRLAWYVDANYRNIMQDWPYDYYRQSRVAWVNLPDYEGLCDAQGQPVEANPVHEDDVVPKPWLRNITLRGVDYYWNPETKATTWTKPL